MPTKEKQSLIILVQIIVAVVIGLTIGYFKAFLEYKIHPRPEQHDMISSTISTAFVIVTLPLVLLTINSVNPTMTRILTRS